jgi:Family of unknown function (DUF6049)
VTAGAWRRRSGLTLPALLVGALVALLTVTPLTGPAARAQTAEPLPLTLTISTLIPTAPQPGDLITVSGQLTNPTDVEYDDVSINLRISPTPLLSRAGLLAVVNNTDHFPSDPVGTSFTVALLAPGGSADYELQVHADDLALVQSGVYRFAVEATQQVDGEAEYEARVNTFLPWLPPSAAVPPVHIAWLWPLLSTPHLEPDNTFTDDSLSGEIAPRGRLGALLGVATQAAAQTGHVTETRVPLTKGETSPDPAPIPVAIRPVPVTPVVDPENVQELELMTGPYRVGQPGSTTAGTGTATATAYLAELRTLMGKTSSIAVPYADPDIEALTKANAAALVTQARSTGIESTLPGIVAGLVWPPDGVLSENALDQLTTSGLVLSAKALPIAPGTSPAYTPTAATTVDRLGGTVPAVVVDDGLSNLATKQIHGPEKVLIAQRFAAETAAIAVEATDGAPADRALVIAPSRRWSPTNTSVRALLDETGRLPWISPETVPEVLQQEQPDPAVTRGPLQLPTGNAAPETLPQGLANQIAAADTELGSYRSILCPPVKTAAATPAPTTTTAGTGTGAVACGNADDEVLPLQRSLYRTASTAFRKPGSGGEALLAATLTSLRKSESKVKIITNGTSLLVGNRGRVAITIVNNLTVPVRVKLILISHSPALHTTPAESVLIPAGGRPQLDVQVQTARAGAGTLLFDAQLLTPENHAFGAPAHLKLRVSAYGVVVVTITAVVCGLLVLAVIVRIYRRLRNARRGPPEEAPDISPGVSGNPAGEPA